MGGLATHKRVKAMQEGGFLPSTEFIGDDLKRFKEILFQVPADKRKSVVMAELAAQAVYMLKQIDRCNTHIETSGDVIAQTNGMVRANPSVRIRNDAMEQLRRIFDKLKVFPAEDARELQRKAGIDARHGGADSIDIEAYGFKPFEAKR